MGHGQRERPSAPAATAGAKQSLLGVTRRSDGKLQVTYAGHPLYTFVQDTKRGQTNGQNLDKFGAEWYVLAPAGTKIEKGPKAESPGAPATEAPSSGGGYGNGYGSGGGDGY